MRSDDIDNVNCINLIPHEETHVFKVIWIFSPQVLRVYFNP